MRRNDAVIRLRYPRRNPDALIPTHFRKEKEITGTMPARRGVPSPRGWGQGEAYPITSLERDIV